MQSSSCKQLIHEKLTPTLTLTITQPIQDLCLAHSSRTACNHGLWKEVYLPSPSGSSSSCSLGEGSRGCRGSMLMISCLFKEWELRLWVMLALKTDTSQIGLVSIANISPSISVGCPSWNLPLDSHSGLGQWKQ